MSKEKTKISPAKGRPMLRWVDKKPLDYVKGFPAQLIEVFDPLSTGPKIELPSYDKLNDKWQNLLFCGDNKEVMATLIENGFRSKVDFIYIDPPFKSGADYVRKIQLRGLSGLGRLDTDDANVLQQVMYEDIWNRDNYLQFMYERLLLMHELLSEGGSIYVHMDWHVGHYLKLVLDEVFGPGNFVEEIIWAYGSPSGGRAGGSKLVKGHDSVFHYAKGYHNRSEEKIYLGYSDKYIKEWFKYVDEDGRPYQRRMRNRDEAGQVIWERQYLDESRGVPCSTVWTDIQQVYADPRAYKSNVYTEASLGFQTLKPEKLILRMIEHSCESDSLVLDAFIGGGTTAAAAQRLNMRWIGCDINKGAVQMTSKRLQQVIHEQIRIGEESKDNESPKYCSFNMYQVNNYDLRLLKTEAMELAAQHIGIQRVRTDAFFDGTLGKSLVRIIDFNHPLTLLDLQLIQDEFRKRPNEDRDVTVVCLGKELSVDSAIQEWNKKHPVNKIKVIELKTDKKYGSFLIHKPSEARIVAQKVDKKKMIVEIQEFVSPTIVERLNIQSGVLRVRIPDFRSMIDTVLIDNNYDGKIFHIVQSDVPQKRDDLVQGKYEIELPNAKAKVAVKIIDMLGEEVVTVVAP